MTRISKQSLPQRRTFRRALSRNPQLAVGILIAVLFLLVALAPALFAPYDPLATNVRERMQGPTSVHLLGTDRLGRDVLSRVVHGSRISLSVGLFSTLVAALTGGALGLLAGFYRGRADMILSRLMDILFSFPALILAITLAAALGPGSQNAIVAIAVVYTPLFFRVMRGPVLSIAQLDYVAAARALGQRDGRLMRAHIFPNAVSSFSVELPLTLSRAILMESYLSFLGLGVQPPAPSWGTSLAQGVGMLERAPWLSIYPGLAIVLAVVSFNLIGDALRDKLDPRG